ncbi:hypothetical protein QFC22_002604 [Naganishia vaughanmartiniae]|uniref:Uncharacterized protein n=1 Tax=Naganishia vaughanmartiniae TaxID=1424756 RepID=A0ACC2XA40_9TREE|nr:hypothetical protein QFC22_002604 [Naganishia vaughanmartiniae]
MSQAHDMLDHIAIEEYLGSLDHPAAILLCLSETEYGHSSNPVLSPNALAVSSSKSQGSRFGASRPELVRMGSGTGSYNWPSTYGSTTSSTSSTDRIPVKLGKSPSLRKRSGAWPTPPDECKLLWGNRYMTADTEELLIEELSHDGLLQRVWSLGNGKSNKIFTLASKQSSERRIVWRITPIRNGRYLILTGREETQDPVSWNDDPAEVEKQRPKTPPRWLSVPGMSDATRQHNELFGSVDWASTPLGPPERAETYFTWSMIPLRGPTGAVDGIFIPNFDNTARVISERRMQTLNILSRAIAESRTVEHIAARSLPAFQDNNDIGFMIMYLSEVAGGDLDQETQDKESQRTRSTTGSSRSRQHSLTGDDMSLEFQLAVHTGFSIVEDHDRYIPRNVRSDRLRPVDSYDDEDSYPLARYIRMAHCDEAVVISEADNLTELLPNLSPNPFGDFPINAIVMPIRSSMEDRTHGIVIIGLNTRLEFNTAYKDWLNTIKGLLATGLASVKLHGEQMARARYLAALTKRKNDELQVLLKKKTDDLRSAELTMSMAFDCCPTGIWISNAADEIVFLNPAYYQITGLNPSAPLASWTDLVHPDDLEMATRALAECRYMRSKTEFRILKPPDSKHGSPETRWLESIAGPPYDSSGQLCGTIMDITHRKEKEEYQVRRAEDALERKRQQESFIDMLRNPLSAICLAVEGIVDQLDVLATGTEASVQAELRNLIKDTEVVSLCTAHMKR